MIRSVIKAQDKLIRHARFWGNNTLRPVLAFNAAYEQHKKMTGKLSVIEDDETFCRAYGSRLKYMLNSGKASVREREIVTLEEFLCWKDRIIAGLERSIPSWFLEEQTNIIGQAVNIGVNDVAIVSGFNQAYLDYPRINAGGNEYVFRIKFQNKLDAVSRETMNFLEKYKRGAEQKRNYNLWNKIFSGSESKSRAELA